MPPLSTLICPATVPLVLPVNKLTDAIAGVNDKSAIAAVVTAIELNCMFLPCISSCRKIDFDLLSWPA